MQMMSVGDITRYIKALLDDDPVLGDVWVAGEVSNLKRAASGHCYFTLKDDESEIHCVMWRQQVLALPKLPEQGSWVEAHGYVSVYERGGAYQFYADTLEQGGVGALWREFQALKERLETEGLFDETHKRALPRWPHRIGVVTSPDGAAFQDIKKVLEARYPLAEVVLSPSLVQGVDAPKELVRALRRLYGEPDIAVIILARGGGSLEDLWAFNDEGLARAVYGSPIPVVTGVGHQTDFTIVDFVADLRAPTPSAAAAAVAPDRCELSAQLGERRGTLKTIMDRRIAQGREILGREERLLASHSPERLLVEYRQWLDDCVRRGEAAIEHGIALRQAHLARYRASLQALNPRQVLQRGYALVEDRASGQRMQSVTQATLDQEISIRVYDGCLGARITRVPDEGSL